MVPAPWTTYDFGPKGEIVGYNDERHRTVYQPGVDILQVFDAERAAAVYWTPSYRYIPWWESSFPLRTAIHWWTTTTPSLQPMHAGAVGRDDGGVLIAGRGGAGKSTTSLACLDGGLLYAGDDYVLVDVDQPTVYSLYNTAKLRPENLHRFPHLGSLVANADSLGDQKAMLFLHQHRPEQRRCELSRPGDRAPTRHGPASHRDLTGHSARHARGDRAHHDVPAAGCVSRAVRQSGPAHARRPVLLARRRYRALRDPRSRR